jgi:potassium channel subfamily K
VTVLTVGFGDLYPTENAGRALVIPYSVIGIIMLGLVIGAIFKSVSEIGEKNIIRTHYEKQREQAKDKTVRSSLELQRKEIELELARERAQIKQAARPSARSTGTGRQLTFALETRSRKASFSSSMADGRPPLSRQNTLQRHVQKEKKIIMLKDEKDRFDAMRGIQKRSEAWRRWYRLTVSLTVFAVFWCVGAVFFWQAERATLGQTYWQSIYFCWVSLLSIGYGDFSPKTGAGRCFFFIWSLIAVPTMTILASDLTSTVVAFFNHWSNTVADFTILPSSGLWRNLKDQWPKDFIKLPQWLKKAAEEEDAASNCAGIITTEPSMAKTMDTFRSHDTQASRDEALAAGLVKADIETLASQHGHDTVHHPDANALARQLALAIRRTATDLQLDKPREYTYEEWVEFTRLIRFSAVGEVGAVLREDEDEGMIEWDWIGEDSPMMAQQTEPEFVLDRLCESLVRYLKKNPPKGEFIETLKEKGEEALKLKSGALSEAEEGEGRDFDSYTLTGSVKSGSGNGKVGEKDAGALGGLDPLHEHDDEHGDHEITPVNKEG